jgi:hypothetical protein
MAAVSDRLSRAVPVNSLKPFDRHRFADLVPPRCCAAAHFAPLHRINHAVTQVLLIRALRGERAQEVAEIIGEGMNLEPRGVGGE